MRATTTGMTKREWSQHANASYDDAGDRLVSNSQSRVVVVVNYEFAVARFGYVATCFVIEWT